MRKTTLWLVLIVLLGAALAWYFTSWEPAGKHPSVIAMPEALPVIEEPAVEFPIEELQPPADTIPEPEPLPSFEDSDSAIIEALSGLVGVESLDTYFVLEQVISRLVATIDSLPSREIAPLVMPLRPVEGKFIALDEGDSLRTNPDNDTRYAAYVQLAVSLDTERLISIYVRFYPLFQEAYESLGYPDAYFNDRLVEVLDHLLDTPEVSGPVTLLKPEAVYLFEDENLEALSAGQKTMLRTGSGNMALLKDKLREVRAALSRRNPRLE